MNDDPFLSTAFSVLSYLFAEKGMHKKWNKDFFINVSESNMCQRERTKLHLVQQWVTLGSHRIIKQ